MKQLEDFLKTYDAGTLLDIACGGGSFTRRIVEHAASCLHITGVDIKAGARNEFLSALAGHAAEFVTSPVRDYLSTAGTFDTISVSNALHHLEDVGEVMKVLPGHLKDGGRVIVNEMHRDGLTPTQQTQHRQHRLLADLHRAAGEYHRETWSRHEIFGFIEAAGLSVQHTFENNNETAEVSREPGQLVERARGAIDGAYPDGAPQAVSAELEDLVRRATEIGASPPPQLTLVCVVA
jgi:2-polyprenyl-3-methyl-5-hydroxy-6-metoxy-1,4-benzoquinol methylase